MAISTENEIGKLNSNSDYGYCIAFVPMLLGEKHESMCSPISYGLNNIRQDSLALVKQPVYKDNYELKT